MPLLSRFLYGENFELAVDFAHGMHNVVYDRAPTSEAEFVVGGSGAGVANVKRWDHTCTMMGRWIKAAPGTAGESPLSGGKSVLEFMAWARDLQQFRFVPDVTFPKLWVPECYLVSPAGMVGSINALLDTDVRFTIRSRSATDFGLAFRGLFHHMGPTMAGAKRIQRATVAYGYGGTPRRYRQVAIDQLVTSHRAHGQVGAIIDGVDQTNLALKSSFVDHSESEWGVSGGWALADVVSIIDGETAKKWTHADDGGERYAAQTIGTFTGNAEAIMLIVENVDALTTSFGVIDLSTGPTWEHRATLTWATGVLATIDNNGTVELLANELLAAVGPNGGEVRRLVINYTGIASNVRSLRVYPTGTGSNALATILHHVQLVEREVTHSVIVTDTASVLRSQDDVRVEWPWDPQAMWVYLKFVDIGIGEVDPTNPRILALEDLSLSRPNPMWAFTVTAERRVRWLYKRFDAGGSSETEAATGVHGDLVECLGLIEADGRLTLKTVRNGGTEASRVGGSTFMADHWANAEMMFGRATTTVPTSSNNGSLLMVDIKAGAGVAVNTIALARAA